MMADEEGVDYSSASDDSQESEIEDTLENHKETLDRLKKKDPEFYKFLQENDQELLNFDKDEDDDGGIGEEYEDEEGGEVDDEEKGVDEVVNVNIEQINEWSKLLNEKADRETIRKVVLAFKSAVGQASGDSKTPMKVVGSEMFNAVMHLCLVDLLPAIHKYLHMPSPTALQSNAEGKLLSPAKLKNWKKISVIIRSYLTQLVNMLNVISDSSLIATLLRHVLYLIPFFSAFSHLTKRILKKVMELWSEGEDDVRVLAFLCILRISRNEDKLMLSFILKKLYFCYVKNCKFTSESTWPMISFMRQSLVELYSLDHGLAYSHAFIFLKQLAIHLRNALSVKKKESFKSVYNWQYVHSLLLWSHLLSCLHQSEVLNALVYPVVQITMACIRLIPSPRFFPLRFHLINSLVKLSDETNTFIPILPLITEVFDHIDYSKKRRQSSSDDKEMDFNNLLKVSQQNIHDSNFRDATINKVYESILSYLSTQSYRIGFSELAFVSVIKMKKFVKTCNNSRHSQLLKQLIEKIDENSKLMNDKRRKVTFSITDANAIKTWEMNCKDEGTPLSKFYENWKKIRLEMKKKKMAERDEKEDGHEKVKKSADKIEKLKEKKRKRKAKSSEDDEEDDDGLDEKKQEPAQGLSKQQRKRNSRRERGKIRKSKRKVVKINEFQDVSLNEALDMSDDDD